MMAASRRDAAQLRVVLAALVAAATAFGCGAATAPADATVHIEIVNATDVALDMAMSRGAVLECSDVSALLLPARRRVYLRPASTPHSRGSRLDPDARLVLDCALPAVGLTRLAVCDRAGRACATADVPLSEDARSVALELTSIRPAIDDVSLRVAQASLSPDDSAYLGCARWTTLASLDELRSSWNPGLCSRVPLWAQNGVMLVYLPAAERGSPVVLVQPGRGTLLDWSALLNGTPARWTALEDGRLAAAIGPYGRDEAASTLVVGVVRSDRPPPALAMDGRGISVRWVATGAALIGDVAVDTRVGLLLELGRTVGPPPITAEGSTAPTIEVAAFVLDASLPEWTARRRE